MAQSPRPPSLPAARLLTATATATAALALVLGGCAAPPAPVAPAAQPPAASLPQASPPAERPAAGRKDGKDGKQVGKASIYADKFHGRTMADGSPMSLHDDNAASKTLPLGSRARVKNLETGQSVIVTIQDRGPHVPGRIIDLSPASAARIGLTLEEGLADVEVTPLSAATPRETVGSSSK